MAKTSPGAYVERPCLPWYRRRDKRTRGMVRGMRVCQRGHLGSQVLWNAFRTTLRASRRNRRPQLACLLPALETINPTTALSARNTSAIGFGCPVTALSVADRHHYVEAGEFVFCRDVSAQFLLLATTSSRRTVVVQCVALPRPQGPNRCSP